MRNAISRLKFGNGDKFDCCRDNNCELSGDLIYEHKGKVTGRRGVSYGEAHVYDMAKGTHILMFQKAIDGISLALSEAWNSAPLGVTKVPSSVQYSWERKASISNSRSQMRRSATDCTRPAERATARRRSHRSSPSKAAATCRSTCEGA